MAQTQAPGADPVELAAELRSLLARNAAQAESDRRLPAENVEALEGANLFKLMVPRRWGGYAASLPTAIRTFAELAKGCGSTGWVAMILNGCGWWASLLSDRGQEEVFASAQARVCAAGAPSLTGLRVPGGVLQRALYAALRLQEAARRYSAQLVAEGGTPLEARVGINTGEVVVRTLTTADGHIEYTPTGHTANLASRMQAIAPTGSIAITDQTRRLVEGFFQLKSLGLTRVKGLTEPINVYEVTGLGPLRTRLQRAAARGLTRFVGRDREMDALGHALEQAQAGHGQIVAAMAEPGIGKSRLFYEFKATSQYGCMVLEAYSVSHGKASSYVPVIELLHNYFRIVADDDPRQRRQKVIGKLLELDRSLEDVLPYLFALLGLHDGDDPMARMDAQIRRRRTQEGLKRIFIRESPQQPLIMIFEDLHLIDADTQAVLNLLADSIANARILLLVNYRPEYRHDWGHRTHYTQLRRDPLGRETAEEMLDALLLRPLARSVAGEGKRGDEPRAGEGADLTALKRLIIERTDGNPLFIGKWCKCSSMKES